MLDPRCEGVGRWVASKTPRPKHRRRLDHLDSVTTAHAGGYGRVRCTDRVFGADRTGLGRAHEGEIARSDDRGMRLSLTTANTTHDSRPRPVTSNRLSARGETYAPRTEVLTPFDPTPAYRRAHSHVVRDYLQALRRGRPRRAPQRRPLGWQARHHRRDHRPQPRTCHLYLAGGTGSLGNCWADLYDFPPMYDSLSRLHNCPTPTPRNLHLFPTMRPTCQLAPPTDSPTNRR